MPEKELGTYEAPKIVYEGDLEIRAGSPDPVSGFSDEFDGLLDSGH